MNKLTNRRAFLQTSASCGAYLLAMSKLAPTAVRNAFSAPQENEKLFEQPWGWIEKLADNTWSHISTPFEQSDWTTVCNGGIVAGKERVLAIESFQKPEGAKWLAERAKELTGRWPTDIVLTHFHGDHVSGSSGYQTEKHSPQMWITKTTEDRIRKDQEKRPQVTLLENLKTIDENEPTELDLGGRTVKLIPSVGHTDSDMVIELVDPNILFCGDLLWNRLAPNYRDANPMKLKREVAKLLRASDKATAYVPGHGPMASLEDVKLFQEFLDMIETAVIKARKAGKDAKEAADDFKLQGKFEDWYVFADSVLPTAFRTWYALLDEK